jgi:hypothetical protein
MRNSLHSTLTLCALLTGLISSATAAEAGRFLLSFPGNERLAVNELQAWPIPTAPSMTRVQGRNVLSGDKPVRLIRDTDANIEFKVPLVMLANGDVINGLPQRLTPSDGRLGQPQRVLVQLESPLMPVDASGVNVRTDRVERIVGHETRLRKPPPPAGTVMLLDGRELKGTSIRWREYGLAVLTDEGIIEAAFTELADVVFPSVNQLAAVLEDSLGAGSATGPTLMRIAVRSGAVLTASRVSREVERSRSRRSSRVEVMYYVQPAWSTHPIAIPEGELAWVGYRSSTEIPLSLLPATTNVNSRQIGQPQDWLRNRTASGNVPATGRDECDLGISTHATSEIVFTMPEGAASFSTVVGFDRSSGEGGCVRCQVAAWDEGEEQAAKILWDSGVFCGSDGPKSTGAIDVKGLKQLVLITLNAHADRPDGADPFDIRDDVVWLLPLVEFNPAKAGGSQSVVKALPGLEAWEQVGEGWSSTKIGQRWNEAADRWEAVVTIPPQAKLQLRRKVKVDATCDVLELMTALSLNPKEQQLELTVNGEVVAWQPSEGREEFADRYKKYVTPWIRRNNRYAENREDLISDALAYWWDLQSYRGREVTLELTITGSTREYPLVWQDFSLRSAIGNLPASGELPKVDVPLTEIALVDSAVREGRGEPTKDMLPYTKKYVQPIRFLGQVRTGGYGLIRNTHYTFELKPEFKKFVAVVGGVKQFSGPVRVTIDGKVAWERLKVSALHPAEIIEIPIPAGSKQLSLQCGADGGYDSAAAWADAGFVK